MAPSIAPSATTGVGGEGTGLRRIELPVSGMTCDRCAQAVERLLDPAAMVMYLTMGTGRLAPREIVSARIARVLSAFPQVEAGYLFGSFLEREDFRDIDVAVRFSESAGSPAALRKLASRIGRELEKAVTPRREVDVRILNAAPIGFQHAVVKRRNPVFVPDEVARIRYEAAVLSVYLDYQETLEWFNRRFLAGIR